MKYAWPWMILLPAMVCCGGGEGEEGGNRWSKDEEESLHDDRTLVEIESVGTGSVSDYLSSTGAVESEAQADLVPEATGTVVAIHAEEGDRVRRGQVLALISNASLDASLARAQAELARAELEVERLTPLQAQGAVAESEFQTAIHGLTTARTGLEEAMRTQGHTRLVSPIDGTVSVRDLRYGEVAGGARAFQVVDLSRLMVVVHLPERDLSRIQVGQLAQLRSVYDETASTEAVIHRIAPTVDVTTGTVRVTLKLSPEQQVLRPGQFVSVRMEVGLHQDVLVVDRRAVTYENGEPRVFLVGIEEAPVEEEEENSEEEEDEDPEPEYPGPRRIARSVPVELGFVDPTTAEIVSGLALGDEVVVLGNAGLRDGARVRFATDPTLADAEEEQGE